MGLKPRDMWKHNKGEFNGNGKLDFKQKTHILTRLNSTKTCEKLLNLHNLRSAFERKGNESIHKEMFKSSNTGRRF